MKVETSKDIHGDNARLASCDMVVKCKNCSHEIRRSEDSKDGRSRSGGRSEKQTKKVWNEPESEEEKENAKLVNLVEELKQKCQISDLCPSDMISRSPMKTHECHHYYKPYDYSHPASRTYAAVDSRAVEGERTSDHHPNGISEELSLQSVGQWVEEVKTNPTLFKAFVKNILEKSTAEEISDWSGTNEWSNVSSRFASPAQSPSEQVLTSPESLASEDHSFYLKPVSVPSSNRVGPAPTEETDARSARRSPGAKLPSEENGYPVADGEAVLENSLLPSETLSNIGSVMLKLNEGFFENTIDLNQFAAVCGTRNDCGPEPSTAERDALNRKLDLKVKENAWATINGLDLDLLGKGDKDGDTQLMILLMSEEKNILEYVYIIVERLLKEKPEYLWCRNKLNQDALYLAACEFFREPLVPSYIAEALVRGKQDFNMKYENGYTLLHYLARKKDSHSKVLERLVKLRHPDGTPVFDVNKKNNQGLTPLHVACEVHKRGNSHAYQTIRVLMENGADCTAKDYKDENTPIHTLINESCDAELLRVILENYYKSGPNDGTPPPTTVPNRQGNTPLHLACGRNTLELSHQQEMIRLLLQHGAMIQLKNINGCVPSVLVDSGRKQEIKAILHSCRQKY